MGGDVWRAKTQSHLLISCSQHYL